MSYLILKNIDNPDVGFVRDLAIIILVQIIFIIIAAIFVGKMK